MGKLVGVQSREREREMEREREREGEGYTALKNTCFTRLVTLTPELSVAVDPA